MEELAGEVGLADTNLMPVIRVGGAVGVAPHMGPLAISGIWGMGGQATLWPVGRPGNLFRSSQSHSLPLPVIFSQLNR